MLRKPHNLDETPNYNRVKFISKKLTDKQRAAGDTTGLAYVIDKERKLIRFIKKT